MIELTEFFLLAICALSQRPSGGVSLAQNTQQFRYLCALTHFARRPPDGAPQNPQQNSGLLELTAEFFPSCTSVHTLDTLLVELLQNS